MSQLPPSSRQAVIWGVDETFSQLRPQPSRPAARSFVLSCVKPCGLVEDEDIELFCPLNDFSSFPRGNAGCNFCCELRVVHQQHVNVLGSFDAELVEAVPQHVASFLVRPVADVGHEVRALELAAHAAINTLGLSP